MCALSTMQTAPISRHPRVSLLPLPRVLPVTGVPEAIKQPRSRTFRSPRLCGEGRGEGQFPKLRLAVTPPHPTSLALRSTSRRTRGEGRNPSVIGPCCCQAAGAPVFFCPGTNPRERSAERRVNNSTLARRGACRARHARLSALHRGGFCRRDCSVRHPDRPFGLIPQASACVRPGASATRRALVVGPGSNPEAPGDGLRNHPQAPHPLRQSRRLMMAPPDEQAATGYRTPLGKKPSCGRYPTPSASACFDSEKPVDSVG